MNQYLIKDNPHITALHTFFQRTYPADYRFHGESHNFYEFVTILSGNALITADSNVFPLKSGQAFLHPPMQFHNIVSMGNTPLTIGVTTFSGKHIPKLFNQILDIDQSFDINCIFHNATTVFKIRDVWVYEADTKNNNHIKAVKNIEYLLLTLTEHKAKPKKQSIGERHYTQIVKTLEDNLTKNLKVKDIAEMCNMSVIGLQKTFNKFAGVGVIDYFNTIKMRKAIELLKEEKSVKEISLYLGYSDSNYFSTVFKRVTGTPPTKFL